MPRLHLLFLGCALYIGATPILAASFDCKKAETRQERLICGSRGLSILDDMLAVNYRYALLDAKNIKTVKEQQRHWLSDIRGECETSSCLVGAYRDRIDDLRSQLSAENKNRIKNTELPRNEKLTGLYNKIQPIVKQKTRVPLRLPSNLDATSLDYPLFAQLAKAIATQYEILIDYTPDCSGSTACMLAFVSGRKLDPNKNYPLDRLPSSGSLSSDDESPRGTPVQLSNDIQGYFFSAQCGASCGYSILMWRENDNLYMVGIKAGPIEVLKKVAKSTLN